MSENCNHNCSDCSLSCNERTTPQSLQVRPHEMSHIKKVIGIVSGKGGVGKSLVTSLLATSMQKKGFKTAILDADITGPSIPKLFGIQEKADITDFGTYPVTSKNGTKIISINLLLENEKDPVIWRGPIIAGTVREFWSEIIWEDVDYMFVDMPPGTGDVPLTVFQSLPVDGIIVVASPQELVEMIVEKAVRMANMLNIPILGLVENMSYFECPDCHKKHYIFGNSHVKTLADAFGIKTIAQIPINPEIASAGDHGEIEKLDAEYISNITDILEKLS